MTPEDRAGAFDRALAERPPGPGDGMDRTGDHLRSDAPRSDRTADLGVTADLGSPFATWNPADRQADVVLSPDLLTASEGPASGSYNDSVRATRGRKAGKRYLELTILDLVRDFNEVGVATSQLFLELGPCFDDAGGCGYDNSGAVRCAQGSFLGPFTAYQVGDVVGIAADLDAGLIYFSVNGAWQAGGQPATGTGGLVATVTSPDGELFPTANISQGDSTRANFGQKPFAYPVPAGFTGGW